MIQIVIILSFIRRYMHESHSYQLCLQNKSRNNDINEVQVVSLLHLRVYRTVFPNKATHWL